MGEEFDFDKAQVYGESGEPEPFETEAERLQRRINKLDRQITQFEYQGDMGPYHENVVSAVQAEIDYFKRERAQLERELQALQNNGTHQ